jgi:DNA-binding transcriptional LysR family regulator
LRVFQSVATHSSFTRASEDLHLSQPAVSIQVKQLEGTIGHPLFEQLGKKIFLTEAGEILYACSEEVFRVLDEAAEVLDQLKGIHRGRLNISVATTASAFATLMLSVFARQYPEVAISLDVTNRARLLNQLDTNKCDFVIMGEPPQNKDLQFKSFMENPLVIMANPEHQLIGRRRIPLTALQDLPFVVREPGSGTRAAIQRFFESKGVSVQFVMEMTSHETIKQAVQAGLGLGIASLHTLELELQSGRLVLLDVQGFPILRHWYLVQRSGKRLSPVAKLFETFVLEQGPRYAGSKKQLLSLIQSPSS